MDRALVEIATGDPLPYLADPDAAVRRLAASACHRRISEPAVRAALVELLADADEAVRAEAVEVLGSGDEFEAVWRARLDPSPRVVEAAATALGEIGSTEAVPWLIETAADEGDKLVREAAIASLGAIGDNASLPVLVELAANGPPQLRRRAVVALTAFEDPAASSAIAAAQLDRNPMVREVAEAVLGRSG